MELANLADTVFRAENLVMPGVDITCVTVIVTELQNKPDICGHRQNIYLFPLRVLVAQPLDCL